PAMLVESRSNQDVTGWQRCKGGIPPPACHGSRATPGGRSKIEDRDIGTAQADGIVVSPSSHQEAAVGKEALTTTEYVSRSRGLGETSRGRIPDLRLAGLRPGDRLSGRQQSQVHPDCR